ICTMYIKYLRRYVALANPFYYIQANTSSPNLHSPVFETDECDMLGEILPAKNRTELSMTLQAKSEIVILTPNKYLTINA
ncbi:MAG TPA: hypothetical protein VN455_09425, partial [Methanotrichaceae archaeon]|nr:hypothetical protein [Methanotrichaceae archaeon]